MDKFIYSNKKKDFFLTTNAFFCMSKRCFVCTRANNKPFMDFVLWEIQSSLKIMSQASSSSAGYAIVSLKFWCLCIILFVILGRCLQKCYKWCDQQHQRDFLGRKHWHWRVESVEKCMFSSWYLFGYGFKITLFKEWENKVNASGALDYDSNRSIPPPAVRQPQQIKQQPMSQIYVPVSWIWTLSSLNGLIFSSQFQARLTFCNNNRHRNNGSLQALWFVFTFFVIFIYQFQQPGSSNFAQPSAQQQQRQAPPNVQVVVFVFLIQLLIYSPQTLQRWSLILLVWSNWMAVQVCL